MTNATMTAAAKASSNPWQEAARAKKVAALVALLNRRVAYDKVPVTRGSVLGLPGWARRIAEREAGVNVSSDATWAAVAEHFPVSVPAGTAVGRCWSCDGVIVAGEQIYRSLVGDAHVGCTDGRPLQMGPSREDVAEADTRARRARLQGRR